VPDGYSDLQRALRPFVLDRVPSLRQGERTDLEPLFNGKKLQGGGNGEEYLLRSLKLYPSSTHFC